MAQTALTDNSPWMKALLSMTQGDDAPPPEQLGDAVPAQAAQPSATPPAHRIEDDKTAGTRGVTPQGGDLSARVGASQAPGDSTGFYTGASHPQQLGAASLPLERQLTTDRAEMERLNAPSKPPTLMQRIGGGVRGALMGAGGLGGEILTLRDRAEARKQQEKESLANRIAAGTRSLSEEGMRAQGQVAAAERLGQTLSSRERVAGEQIQGRADVAGMRIGAQEDELGKRIQSQQDINNANLANKAETRVMGDKTYQHDPKTDTWREIGKAPINVTRAGNAPVGGFTQPVVNAAGDTVGWINPKLQGDAAFRPVTSIPSAAAAAGGNGALPMKPSGQTASRMQQGDAIQKAGDNLIADVRAKASKMGNWSNFWKQMTSGTPLADPDQNYLANQIMSFAALQPAAHGARGLQAIQAFEKAVGGTPTNIEAFIAGVQGIQRGLQPLRPSTPQNPQTQPPPLANRTPPRDAKSFLALYPKGVQ